MNVSRVTNGWFGFSCVGERLRTFLLLTTTAWIVCLSGCDAPLNTYKPKSVEEQALKTILLDFETGVNERDADKVAGLIHPDAKIMIGRERKILSKSEYLSILRQRLAESPPMTLGKPKITVNHASSEVKVYMTRGDAKLLIVFNMLFENERWHILRWEY